MVKLIERASIEKQKERYDIEAAEYLLHHGDQYSQAYRSWAIRDRLFNFNIEGLSVLDAMGGPGVETGYLIARGSVVVGLDVSPENAKLYEQTWHKNCIVSSIHDVSLPSESFDIIYISGGLHHVLPMLDAVMIEVYRLLKPNGYFCFVEPNSDTVLNKFRNFWYQKDSRFQDDEEAISYSRTLKPYLRLGYQEDLYFTGGNIAYLTIGQSMIIGVPTFLKKIIYTPMCFFEKMLNFLPVAPHLFFAARWVKK